MSPEVGWKSPEFWLSLVAAVLPQVLNAIAPFMSPVVQSLSLAVAGALAAHYTASAHSLKAQALPAPVQAVAQAAAPAVEAAVVQAVAKELPKL